MENTLDKMPSFERYTQLQEAGYTPHDWQTSEFVQDLLPFLKDVQHKIISYETRIQYLENRVKQLDRLI